MSIKYISVNNRDNQRTIAYCHDVPDNSHCSILWLSGYCSVMDSTKANAIAEYASEHQIEMIRFDYSGLGKSSGDFSIANFSDWLDEALAVYQQIKSRPTIIIGSSMGAWLSLRLTEVLADCHSPSPKALLLLAPAIDFTHEILLKALPQEFLKALSQEGKIEIPSEYDLESLTFYQQFIEDANRHRLFNRPATIDVPVTIIHGKQDKDIPFDLGLKASQHFRNTQLIAIEDGEHRLSRTSDIHLILNTLKSLLK